MGIGISKEKITAAATGVLLDIGKDIIAAFAPEVYPLFEEWWRERKTADGWSKAERLPYLYTMVSRVKAKQIGPSWFDHLGDFALQAILRELATDMDALDTPKPADPPPPATKPKDYWGQLLYSPPDAKQIADLGVDLLAEQLWWNVASNPIAIRYTVMALGAACYPGWQKVAWS